MYIYIYITIIIKLFIFTAGVLTAIDCSIQKALCHVLIVMLDWLTITNTLITIDCLSLTMFV